MTFICVGDKIAMHKITMIVVAKQNVYTIYGNDIWQRYMATKNAKLSE